MWLREKPIDGVGAAITKLQQNGKNIAYVSNNVMRSPKSIDEKFSESGINSTHVIFVFNEIVSLVIQIEIIY